MKHNNFTHTKSVNKLVLISVLNLFSLGALEARSQGEPGYTADFESDIRPITREPDHYPPLISSGNPPQIVTEEHGITPRGGSHMMKSVVNRFTSSVNYRTEAVAVAASDQDFNGEFEKGKEYWLGVSVFMPAGWSMDYGLSKNGRELEERLASGIILQFHDRSYLDKSWRYGLPLVVSHTKQGFRISNRGDECGNTRPGQQARPGCIPGARLPRFNKDNIPMLLGQWNDFVMHIKWSDRSDGFIDIWVNGNKELEQDGVNYYSEHTKYPYFKMGLYQSSYKLKGWSKDVVYNVNERTLYHDELRIGGSESSFEDVSPDGLPEPNPGNTPDPTDPEPTTPINDPNDPVNNPNDPVNDPNDPVNNPNDPVNNPNDPDPNDPDNGDNDSPLISHYSFDNVSENTIVDSSDQNHNATNHGATKTAGAKGDALHFNGTNQFVDAGKFDVKGQALTLAAWIKVDNFAIHDARIISKAIGVAEQDHYWMLSTIENNGSKLRFRLKTEGQTTTLTGTKNIPVGKWVHVAAVYDGTKMKLFVGGQESGSVNKSGAISINPNVGIYIGDNPAAGKRNFSGAIDDLRVYKQALSTNELTELVADIDNNGDGGDTSPNPDPSAEITYEQGFEEGGGFVDGLYDNLKCHGSHGNCPKVSTEQKKDGSHSMSFDLKYEDRKNTYREEVYVRKGEYKNGKEYWLSMDYRYEDWKKDSNSEIGPFQVHTRPSTWGEIDGVRCALGAAVSTAPFLMVSHNGQVRFKTYGGNVLWTGAVEKKKWLNIKVHFKISTDGDGFVEAWYNGEYIGRVDGPTGPKLDKCGKPMRDPYLNLGVYKWDWKKERPATDSTRRHLFIDNVKLQQLN